MSTKVTINGKEYEAAPLKVKHLRKITEMLAERDDSGKQNFFNTLSRWIPFITESIQALNKDFTAEMVDEASVDELLTAWNTIVAASGIKFTSGETKPTESTGDASMDASAAPSAGHTVM